MFSGDKKWEPWLELGKIDGFSQHVHGNAEKKVP